MSESALKFDQKDFICRVCSDLPWEPVTLPCGHSFCLGCVHKHWDGESQNRPTCPQCRRTFPQRPQLSINLMLATLMAQLNTSSIKTEDEKEESNAALKGIPCDVCPGKRLKATKSCLNCKVSYCDKHVQPHFVVAQYKSHRLVEPRENLELGEERVTSPAKKQGKVKDTSSKGSPNSVCNLGRTTGAIAKSKKQRQKNSQAESKGQTKTLAADDSFVFKPNTSTSSGSAQLLNSAPETNLSFGLDKPTVSTTDQEEEPKLELQKMRRKMRLRIEQKEKALEKLRQTAAEFSSSAEAVRNLNLETAGAMIDLMTERKKSAVQEARSKYHRNKFGIQYFLDNIKEDTEFWEKQRDERIALCFQEKDTFHFLRKWSTLPLVPLDPETVGLNPRIISTFENLKQVQVPDQISNLCHSYQMSTESNLARETMLKHWRNITWDDNTAHRSLSLKPTGAGNPCASFSALTPAGVPDHPDRFSHCVQVLSKEPLTGHCYFELCPMGGCFLGLAYKSVERKGRGSQCVLGLNDKSWSWFGGGLNVKDLNDRSTSVLCPDVLKRVGVYLNHEAGEVIFYIVRGSWLFDVHKVEVQFTEPLYFGVNFLYSGDRVWIPDLNDKPVG